MEAYLLPKKLPMPDPIPPSVLPMSAAVTPVCSLAGVSVAAVTGVEGFSALSAFSFSLLSLSASIRALRSVRAVSNALKRLLEPVASAALPAVKADERASRVGASCWSSFRSCSPSENQRWSCGYLWSLTAQPQSKVRDHVHLPIAWVPGIRSGHKQLELYSLSLVDVEQCRIRARIPPLKCRGLPESIQPPFTKRMENSSFTS